MGYACPVCGAEQLDGVHLANHLAVTASLGRTDHEEWLAEYAPDWSENGPEELADRIVEYAPEIDTPAFESGAGDRPATGFEEELATQARQPGRSGRAAAGGLAGHDRGEPPSNEVQSVIDEARELTEQLLDDGGDADVDESAGSRDENV